MIHGSPGRALDMEQWGNVIVPDDAAAQTATVEVPRNMRSLGPLAPERLRQLRRHLVESLRAERELKRPGRFASPPVPDPAGFAGDVARAACALCGGWCCKGGEEHAYLDERTMARVRRARPELDARALIRLYVERVPANGYAGSCIFHGALGCTLDRALRSDVCNSYFCSGLGKFVTNAGDADTVMIIAGDGSHGVATKAAAADHPAMVQAASSGDPASRSMRLYRGSS